MGMGFGLMGTIFPLLFTAIFLVFIVAFVIVIVKGVSQWSRNNQSPVLTVDAMMVAKRTNITHHHHTDAGDTGAMHSSTSTTYYATFQVESGDRLEFCVSGQEYGLLVEGDQGKLTFQGTRYQGFARQR